MRFEETPLSGAWLLRPDRHADARGFFARTYCRAEFEAHGLCPDVAQASTSFNEHRHTLRGMHWQQPPHAEDKLVRCTAGAVFDALVDLRSGSPSFGNWFGATLTAAGGEQLYVPKGLAHGFLTLEPGSEVHYQMSVFYAPGSEGGLRWDDPDVGIRWPAAPAVIADKDRALPRLGEIEPLDVEGGAP